MKVCTKCKEEKDLDSFHKHLKGKDGLTSSCKSCIKEYNIKYYQANSEKIAASNKEYYQANPEKIAARNKEYYQANKASIEETKRDWYYKKNYGISLDDYNLMLEEQDNCCAICKKHSSENSTVLHVDHCHETGEVRGLLCYKCNSVLGYAKDDIQTLLTAVDYLLKEVTNVRMDI